MNSKRSDSARGGLGISSGPGAFQHPGTLEQAASEEIRRRILSGELAPGEPIRQVALAEALGLSRMPVREALKTLAGEGLVEAVAQRGFFVARLSLNDLTEVYRVLALLEEDVLREAVPHVSAATLSSLDSIILETEMIDATDYYHHVVLNRQFHFTIYNLADRPRTLKIMNNLWDASHVYQALYYMAEGSIQRIVIEHREIRQACATRDRKAVVELFAQHREQAVRELDGLIRKAEAQEGARSSDT